MMAPAGAIRLGAVTGRIPAPAPGNTLRPGQGERRIFTGHVTSPGALPGADVPLVWLPYAQVAEHVGSLEVADLDLFLQGYVGGWIPDGWITLEQCRRGHGEPAEARGVRYQCGVERCTIW